MMTGKEAWDFAKINNHKLPLGFTAYYRTTQYSEWIPAYYNWCVMRDYYYEGRQNTGKSTLEVCLSVKSLYYEYAVPYFLLELDQFQFNSLGFESINQAVDI